MGATADAMVRNHKQLTTPLIKPIILTLTSTCLAVSFACAAEAKGDAGPNTGGSAAKPTRVVCFGDSITKRGYGDVMAKDLGVEVISAGVAGHSSAAGLRRMQKDVIDQKPDIVVIFFGTNDARVDSDRVHVPVKKYEKNLNEMVKACEKIRAKVVICTLPPINEEKYFQRHETEEYDAAGGIASLWGKYRLAAMRVAKKHDLPLVDLNQELLNEPKWLSHDGVHPSPTGTEIIARLVSAKVTPLIKK